MFLLSMEKALGVFIEEDEEEMSLTQAEAGGNPRYITPR